VNKDVALVCRVVICVLGISFLPGAAVAAPPDYRAIVESRDRSESDREADRRRKPEQLLAFAGVRAGMKVLDVGAGNGYSTELLARAVGPEGVVYAQNVQQRMQFDQRVVERAMRKVVPVVRPFDDPAPPEATNLDLVTILLIYHDTTYLPVDREKMNRRLFEALKRGGHLVIVDHAAKAGAGAGVGKSLHRIEEAQLRREVEAAGFKLVAQGDFLRNPEDKRDEPFFDMLMPTDQFALKFVKP
jgi:predicted methyltransferase